MIPEEIVRLAIRVSLGHAPPRRVVDDVEYGFMLGVGGIAHTGTSQTPQSSGLRQPAAYQNVVRIFPSSAP